MRTARRSSWPLAVMLVMVHAPIVQGERFACQRVSPTAFYTPTMGWIIWAHFLREASKARGSRLPLQLHTKKTTTGRTGGRYWNRFTQTLLETVSRKCVMEMFCRKSRLFWFASDTKISKMIFCKTSSRAERMKKRFSRGAIRKGRWVYIFSGGKTKYSCIFAEKDVGG